MPTIFAIDGAEDSGFFGEFGAYSSSVASLQTALVNLGRRVGDTTLSALVLDGLIGPKTTAATNRAFAMYVQGAPANFATGTLSQSQISTNASSLASYVTAELGRRGGTTKPATTAALPVVLPANAPAAVPDSSTQIVKWAALGLGGVVVASVLYYIWRARQGRPAFGGGCDLGAAGIDDHVRAQWVDNDPYLRKLYQNQSYPLRQFIKRQRAHIDARILDARDGFGAGPSQRDMFYRAGAGDWKPYSFNTVKKMATNRWPSLWSLEEVDTPPGTVVRRTTGPLAKHHGKPIAQQFKVRLHSSTGPLHWIVVREDGTPMFDGVGGGRRRSMLGALPQRDADTIESMMDRSGGVSEVFEAIGEIASGKADHVREAWQDERLARKWSGLARKMGALAATTQGFEVK